MGPISLKRGRPPVDRTRDRIVAASSIGLAIAFVGAAGLALLLPEQVRHGLWLPLHLALAGGAATAIAGVMPFFVAAFAAVAPADARLRAAAVAAVSLGALAVTGGVVVGPGWLAVLGGALFIAGIILIGVATLRPIGGSLGPARGLVTRSYVVALAAVAVGATLSTLLLAGWPPVASAWSELKPAHAWLNLFGFVSLVITTTLLHFFPTVIGARIANHSSARLAPTALAIGTCLVATGYALRIDSAVASGSCVALLGGMALCWYEARVWRTRGRWTTDLPWHAFAIGGLVSATSWFIIGLVVATVPAILRGADPTGWSIGREIWPLVSGWVGVALLASASHLLPAIGPGDPVSHARQRRMLGRLAVARLAVIDVGIGLALLGALLAWPSIQLIGVLLLSVGYAATVILLVAAVAVGLRWTRGRTGARTT